MEERVAAGRERRRFEVQGFKAQTLVRGNLSPSDGKRAGERGIP
jgi:hypothetical protein